MSRQLRPGLGVVEISRPVLDAKDFLNQVRYHGDDIFGNDLSSLATDFIIENPDDPFFEPTLKINGIGAPRLNVYEPSGVRMRLLEQKAPTDTNAWRQLRRAANRLMDDRLVGRGKMQTTVKGVLWAHLQAAAEELGVEDAVRGDEAILRLRCNQIELNPDPDLENGSPELALVPSITETTSMVIAKQVVVCYRGLIRAWSPQSSRPPLGQPPFNIPFANLPADSTKMEREKLTDALQKYLPLDIVVGGVRRYVNESTE